MNLLQAAPETDVEAVIVDGGGNVATGITSVRRESQHAIELTVTEAATLTPGDYRVVLRGPGGQEYDSEPLRVFRDPSIAPSALGRTFTVRAGEEVRIPVLNPDGALGYGGWVLDSQGRVARSFNVVEPELPYVDLHTRQSPEYATLQPPLAARGEYRITLDESVMNAVVTGTATPAQLASMARVQVTAVSTPTFDPQRRWPMAVLGETATLPIHGAELATGALSVRLGTGGTAPRSAVTIGPVVDGKVTVGLAAPHLGTVPLRLFDGQTEVDRLDFTFVPIPRFVRTDPSQAPVSVAAADADDHVSALRWVNSSWPQGTQVKATPVTAPADSVRSIWSGNGIIDLRVTHGAQGRYKVEIYNEDTQAVYDTGYIDVAATPSFTSAVTTVVRGQRAEMAITGSDSSELSVGVVVLDSDDNVVLPRDGIIAQIVRDNAGARVVIEAAASTKPGEYRVALTNGLGGPDGRTYAKATLTVTSS